jgi:hypothetical protein
VAAPPEGPEKPTVEDSLKDEISELSLELKARAADVRGYL